MYYHFLPQEEAVSQCTPLEKCCPLVVIDIVAEVITKRSFTSHKIELFQQLKCYMLHKYRVFTALLVYPIHLVFHLSVTDQLK